MKKRVKSMEIHPRRTDSEVLELMKDDHDPLNKARKEFSGGRNMLANMLGQRNGPSAIEMRRLEFEITEKIIAAYGAGSASQEAPRKPDPGRPVPHHGSGP